MVIMGLGKFLFGTSEQSYQTLKRKAEARWPSNMPLGAAPIYQFLGPGHDEITLEGVIYPEWTPGFAQLQAMREQMKAGQSMMLASSAGVIHGMHIIESIEDENTIFHASGMPRKVEFTITLKLA